MGGKLLCSQVAWVSLRYLIMYDIVPFSVIDKSFRVTVPKFHMPHPQVQWL